MRTDKQKLGIALAALPSVLVLLQTAVFYLFVLRARLAIGEWPSPYNPDPKELGFLVHYNLVWAGATLSSMIPIVAIFCFNIAKECEVSKGNLRLATAILLAISGLAIGIAAVDPGQFGEWYAD